MASKQTSSGSSSQTSTTNQKSTPTIDPRLEQFYLNLAGKTDQAVNQVDRSPWVGPAKAGVNSFDTQGVADMSSMLTALKGNMTPGVFTNIGLDAASGRRMDPSTNPTLQGMIEASTRPVTERLTREILPGIDQNAMMDNAFGGDRAALTRGQAAGDWAEAAGDIASGINYDNYNRERQAQLNAAQTYQQGLQAEMALPQMMMALGDQQRSLDQMPIDNALMLRALNEQLAFAGLGQGATIMNSLPFVGQQTQGTTNSTGTSTETTQTKQNPLTSLVQGGLGVGSMMAGLGWNPFGAAAGAAGGVGGGMSNAMLKILQPQAVK